MNMYILNLLQPYTLPKQFETDKTGNLLPSQIQLMSLNVYLYIYTHTYLNILYCVVQDINKVVNFIILVCQGRDNPLQSFLELQKQVREVVKEPSHFF